MDVNDAETETLDGTLVFRPTTESTCKGCVIRGQYAIGQSTDAPPCSAGARKDGRHGIWVRK